MSSALAAHQIVLVLDDDLVITEALSLGLERDDRTVITCNDVETAELAVEWIKPSHVISDVRLTGNFAYEGLDFIRFIKRHSADTRVILMTAEAPDSLQLEASQRGAVGFLKKPFEVDELNALVDIMAPSRSGSPDWPSVIQIPLLDEVIGRGRLSSVFQPIVNLETRVPVGFEALGRCSCASPLRNPETLFKYAVRKHRVADLEAALITESLRRGAALSHRAPLFLNIHPAAFAAGSRLRDVVIDEARRNGVSLDRVVLELTEQASLGDDLKSLDTIQKLKEAGVRFAFDDVGVAYSHLPHIDRIRPSFLKISQQFGGGFEADPTKTIIVRNLLALATDFGCELILEGIESEATASAAAQLGVKYGQGYLFARPADASAILEAFRVA